MSLFRKKESDEEIMTTIAPPVRLMSYQVGNLQGMGSRVRQEDSFTLANAFDVRQIKNKGLLFVVCDGMGGMKDGKVASETAISSIRESFEKLESTADIAIQLKNSIYLAADRVENILEGEGGSTVVAGIIFQEKLYYASVGDSYFYMKRGEHLYRLNQEHNMCHRIYLSCIREGNMNPQEGRMDEESGALTQFLGMTGLSEVDGFVRPMPIREGDVFLACSDGVGGVLEKQEVWDALNQASPQEMCACIEKAIISHNKLNQDNYTAVIVQCVR